MKKSLWIDLKDKKTKSISILFDFLTFRSSLIIVEGAWSDLSLPENLPVHGGECIDHIIRHDYIEVDAIFVLFEGQLWPVQGAFTCFVHVVENGHIWVSPCSLARVLENLPVVEHVR